MTRSSASVKDRISRLSGLVVLLTAATFSGYAAANAWGQVVGRPTTVRLVTTPTIAPASLAQAQELDQLGQEAAVDLYYQAAIQAMPMVGGDGASENVYRLALSGLIDAGQRYGRLDPRRQLVVLNGGTRVVPIRYFGFAWRPDEFCRLVSAEGETSRNIAHHYGSPGLGVPLIGERISACPQEVFFRPWQPFSVTAVLRPTTDHVDPSAGLASADYALDLFNPLVFDQVTRCGGSRPLARDLTAPLAAVVNEAPRQYLRGFTAPNDTSVQPQLVMIEPYQRGKVPVVFIHGLYSDPITWVDMVNELRAHPDLYHRYQFWTFRYPTGGEALESAATLRQRLQLARDTFDCQRTDPAMDAIVLVGHSLGGLISKMQVTASSDVLWREIAQQPFDAVRAGPEIRMRLARDFFFEPVPMVKRVIFIGTPHRGSGMTRRLAGRVGSALVSFGAEEDALYRTLVADNRDVFKPYVTGRRPTTVALLDPDSPLLAGLEKMPVNSATRLHSIIGTGGSNPMAEPGDGVVPVSSARHFSDSELFVPAKHEKLHRHPASINEVVRILRVHAAAAR
jgi:pimeloyl-ACP methyl ester carboxylesterase